MQKLKSLLLAIVFMVVSVSVCITTTYAASGPMPTENGNLFFSPFYINAYTVEADLSISGKTATAYVSLDGNSSAKSVSVTYSLKQKSGSNWITIKTWTASSNSRFLNSQNNYNALIPGTQYRVYATFSVIGTNGEKETITDYSGIYTC